jgi:hypothetical protein
MANGRTRPQNQCYLDLLDAFGRMRLSTGLSYTIRRTACLSQQNDKHTALAHRGHYLPPRDEPIDGWPLAGPRSLSRGTDVPARSFVERRASMSASQQRAGESLHWRKN